MSWESQERLKDIYPQKTVDLIYSKNESIILVHRQTKKTIRCFKRKGSTTFNC